MQRSAGLVLLALVGEVALGHLQCFGHAFMEMRRDSRAGVHNDVQHYGPQSVIRVSDTQRDVAFTGEGETIRLELTVEYFLIDHDAVSRIEEPPCRFNLGGCALVPGTYKKRIHAELRVQPSGIRKTAPEQSISALIRFWLAARFRAARNASRAAAPARYRGDRRRQAEEWLHRRQLPWRTRRVRRAVAPPSQDDCRSGTARVHLRRGARHRLPCLRRARGCRRDLCHQLTSPPRSGRYRR